MASATKATPSASAAPATTLISDESPDTLDWSAFSERYFPGRRRHDFEAITAYVAYQRAGSPTHDKEQGNGHG